MFLSNTIVVSLGFSILSTGAISIVPFATSLSILGLLCISISNYTQFNERDLQLTSAADASPSVGTNKALSDNPFSRSTRRTADLRTVGLVLRNQCMTELSASRLVWSKMIFNLRNWCSLKNALDWTV